MPMTETNQKKDAPKNIPFLSQHSIILKIVLSLVLAKPNRLQLKLRMKQTRKLPMLDSTLKIRM